MTSFSSLGNMERPPQMIEAGDTVLLKDPTITSIAEKHKCSNAQVGLIFICIYSKRHLSYGLSGEYTKKCN